MVSNNTLAGLIVVAIEVSLASVITTVNLASRLPMALTGGVTGVTQVTVATEITISLPINTVDFGTMYVNDVDDTTDGSPHAFVIQNDGSVKVNVTVNATQLWSGTGATGTSSYYQFKSECNETGCVTDEATDLVSSWTNMPIDSAAVKVVDRLDFVDSKDAANVHIKITVPSDEPAGAKSSTVTFTSVAA